MPRRALVAGASGLVGRELIALLSADARWDEVHLLLRRPLPADARPSGPAARKLHEHLVDFGELVRLADLPVVDDAFVCLGTTRRTAGSREAFRRVDFDHVVAVAHVALRHGAQRLAAVSAMGADAGSRIFYSRVKGDAEAALARLGFASTTIVRPSLLIGKRAERRPGERLLQVLLRPVAPLVPPRWRPVPAVAVARCMLESVARGRPGMRVVESDRILQPSG